MTINTLDMQNIIRDSVTQFNNRVQSHYQQLSDDDINALEDVMYDILKGKVSDSAIQNRQYNPKTDKVEEL